MSAVVAAFAVSIFAGAVLGVVLVVCFAGLAMTVERVVNRVMGPR